MLVLFLCFCPLPLYVFDLLPDLLIVYYLLLVFQPVSFSLLPVLLCVYLSHLELVGNMAVLQE